MEFNISDLLDDLQEVTADIRPQESASASRIEELTMKKIHHSEETPKHRGLSAFSKILIAAAILASLALPVMVAAGFHFTDWVDGMFQQGTSYDNDYSQGNHWDVSGWNLELNVKDSSAAGLTLICQDIGLPEKEGTLTAGKDYWLDRWDGERYVRLSDETYQEETHAIASRDTVSWQIKWLDSYGLLEAGTYRIGKTFLYTADSGETEEITVCAKFRVFTEDMSGYIETCRAAFTALQSQESYHLTFYHYPTDTNIDYSYYTTEIWKSGEDYLEELRYINEDGSLHARKGYLLRDGVGYKLYWAGDSVLSGISQWEDADWIVPATFENWDLFLDVTEMDLEIGELYVEGNKINLLLGWTGLSGNPIYREVTYELDEQDALVSIRRSTVPYLGYNDRVLDYALEVHDTSAREIADTIAAQNVGKPAAFSWQAEQSFAGKTDGFVNTTPRTISDAQDAIAAAQAECTLEYQNTAVVFYDETAKMWKVELGHSQDDCCQSVYLDENGITRLIVTG